MTKRLMPAVAVLCGVLLGCERGGRAGAAGAPSATRPTTASSATSRPNEGGARSDHVEKTDAQWRAELTPQQYQVLRQKGTERAFTGEYDHLFEPGSYQCAACGLELFTSETKF